MDPCNSILFELRACWCYQHLIGSAGERNLHQLLFMGPGARYALMFSQFARHVHEQSGAEVGLDMLSGMLSHPLHLVAPAHQPVKKAQVLLVTVASLLQM